MPPLSVIIPFYKDFAYIEQAVYPVLVQPVDDVEIIIVNDNPGPETADFLEQLNFPDCVGIVTHKTNRGLSALRNTGLDHAEGDWIAYLDGGDYFRAGGLAHQLAAARRSGADVTHATTLLRERNQNGHPAQILVRRDAQFFERDAAGLNLGSAPELQFIMSSWKSIYRRRHLIDNNIRFDETQRKFEDRLYMLENAFSGASFAFVAEPARIKRRRPVSITASRKSRSDQTARPELLIVATPVAGWSLALRRALFGARDGLRADGWVLPDAIYGFPGKRRILALNDMDHALAHSRRGNEAETDWLDRLGGAIAAAAPARGAVLLINDHCSGGEQVNALLGLLRDGVQARLQDRDVPVTFVHAARAPEELFQTAWISAALDPFFGGAGGPGGPAANFDEYAAWLASRPAEAGSEPPDQWRIFFANDGERTIQLIGQVTGIDALAGQLRQTAEREAAAGPSFLSAGHLTALKLVAGLGQPRDKALAIGHAVLVDGFGHSGAVGAAEIRGLIAAAAKRDIAKQADGSQHEASMLPPRLLNLIAASAETYGSTEAAEGAQSLAGWLAARLRTIAASPLGRGLYTRTPKGFRRAAVALYKRLVHRRV